MDKIMPCSPSSVSQSDGNALSLNPYKFVQTGGASKVVIEAGGSPAALRNLEQRSVDSGRLF